MDSFIIAVENKFLEGSDFYTSINGRMYFTEAPQQVTFPYCVWFIISDVYDFQFVEEFRTIRVQFTLVSNAEGPSEIEGIYTKLISWANWASFDVSEYDFLYIRMESSSTGLRKETNGEWVIDADFICMMEKLLPSASISPSASASPSASFSPSASVSLSLSKSASVSPSGSYSPSPSPSPSPVP